MKAVVEEEKEAAKAVDEAAAIEKAEAEEEDEAV